MKGQPYFSPLASLLLARDRSFLAVTCFRLTVVTISKKKSLLLERNFHLERSKRLYWYWLTELSEGTKIAYNR
jgi:hypothetical protein